MEANEIVTELYSLRAGLSLIAQEKDAFDTAVEEAENQKNGKIADARAKADSVICNAKERVNQIKQSTRNLDEMLEQAKQNAIKSREQYEQNKKELQDKQYSKYFMEKYKRMAPLHVFVGVLFDLLYLALAILVPSFINNLFILVPAVVVSLAIGITEFVLAANEYELEEIWYGAPYILNVLSFIGLMVMRLCGARVWGTLYTVLFAIAMGSTLICIILTSIRTHNYYSEALSQAERRKMDIPSFTHAQERDADLKRWAEDAERKYSEMKRAYESGGGSVDFNGLDAECNAIVQTEEEKYNVELEKAERSYSERYADLANTYGNISSGVWAILVNTYSGILDVRDWGILDLVIWQLETGRAETLKEALQLADRETQTDRIVQTLQSASAAIAQRIDDGFGRLQSQLSNSFYTLAMGLASATGIISSQISQSSNILADKIEQGNQAAAELYESQIDNMKVANRNLEKLFSQTSIQNALLDKANTSSQKLIEEVKTIRKVQTGY